MKRQNGRSKARDKVLRFREAATTAVTSRAPETIERWVPVRGFEGLYEVSNFGRVRRPDSIKIRGARAGKVLKPSIVEGYPHVWLRKDGRCHSRRGSYVGHSVIRRRSSFRVRMPASRRGQIELSLG